MNIYRIRRLIESQWFYISMKLLSTLTRNLPCPPSPYKFPIFNDDMTICWSHMMLIYNLCNICWQNSVRPEVSWWTSVVRKQLLLLLRRYRLSMFSTNNVKVNDFSFVFGNFYWYFFIDNTNTVNSAKQNTGCISTIQYNADSIYKK